MSNELFDTGNNIERNIDNRDLAECRARMRQVLYDMPLEQMADGQVFQGNWQRFRYLLLMHIFTSEDEC